MGTFYNWNSHCAAAMLLLGEFLELQARRVGEACRLSVLWLAGPATRPSCHMLLASVNVQHNRYLLTHLTYLLLLH